MIRALIPRTFRHGKKKHIGHMVRKRIDVVHRQTHLTSRPTWNDSTGRCSYELTNDIKYLTGEGIGALIVPSSRKTPWNRADSQTIIIFADRENRFTPFFLFFFFFFVITLWLQNFRIRVIIKNRLIIILMV